MLRFRLRTLLIAVAVLAVPIAWVGYQLNWIRQRREWLRGHAHATVDPPTPAPSLLALFGEKGIQSTWYFPGEEVEAQRLFPEAIIGADGQGNRILFLGEAEEDSLQRVGREASAVALSTNRIF